MGPKIDPVVVHVYNTNINATAVLSIKWALIDAPMAKGSKPPTVEVPAAQLSPELPASEIQRRSLQDALKVGWSTWSYKFTNHRRRAEVL